jgi:hypothetical protein
MVREFRLLTRLITTLRGVCLVPLLTTITVSAQEQKVETPLIDQLPFDRIVLNEANDNVAIDVQLLDLPNREVPNPFPENGSLELRRLSDPSTIYLVSWSDIGKIQLYEYLILEEAEHLIASNELDGAYTDLKFLHQNYPDLPGLQAATELYLQRDAMAAFAGKRYDESLAILSALYDTNSERRGLAKAIEGVSDQLISEQLANRDFRAARELLDSLRSEFSNIELANLTAWQEKFSTGAQRQLEIARQSITSGDFSLARQSVQRAIAILPAIEGARELFGEIERLSPQIVVGVAQQALFTRAQMLEQWPDERVGRLTDPRFVELTGVGPEGGEYSSRWADIKIDTSGLRIDLRFNNDALEFGITPDKVALQVLRMANHREEDYRSDFEQVFDHVEVVAGQQVNIHFRRIHVKPIAFLRFPLSSLQSLSEHIAAYTKSVDPENSHIVNYRLALNENGNDSQVIVEQDFPSDEDAIAALSRGDIDVLDQLPPWHVTQASQMAGVTVSSYRLPTVHMLLCNYDNPLMKRREFRRALCYGIDRPRMVAEVLGAKDKQSAFRVLSGPIPAGITFNDAIGYAYKQDLQPLPYEPRLAAVLATSARATLAKRQKELSEEELAEKKSGEEDVLPDAEPLVLLHPADSVARTMCQLIKRQLDTIGIPIELAQQDSSQNPKWDLQYVELCLWEPIVDTRSLLGPGGLAGYCSPTMNLLLNKLDRANNWNDVRSQFHRIHQAAFDELPVIPLWQTLNHFAQREALTGLSKTPASLYQDVSQWRVTYGSEGNLP